MERLPTDIIRYILIRYYPESTYEWLIQLGYTCHYFQQALLQLPELFHWKRPTHVRLECKDLATMGITLNLPLQQDYPSDRLDIIKTLARSSFIHWREPIGELRYEPPQTALDIVNV